MSHFLKQIEKKRSGNNNRYPTKNTNNVKINTLRLKTPRKVPCVKRKVKGGMVNPSVSISYRGVSFSI